MNFTSSECFCVYTQYIEFIITLLRFWFDNCTKFDMTLFGFCKTNMKPEPRSFVDWCSTTYLLGTPTVHDDVTSYVYE